MVNQYPRVPSPLVPGFDDRTREEPVWRGSGRGEEGKEANSPKPWHRGCAGKSSSGRVRS